MPVKFCQCYRFRELRALYPAQGFSTFSLPQSSRRLAAPAVNQSKDSLKHQRCWRHYSARVICLHPEQGSNPLSRRLGGQKMFAGSHMCLWPVGCWKCWLLPQGDPFPSTPASFCLSSRNKLQRHCQNSVQTLKILFTGVKYDFLKKNQTKTKPPL